MSSRLAVLALLGLAAAASGPTAFDFVPLSIEGKPAPLATYRGKVLLIVNVASQSGFASQYAELESLYKKYEAQGLVVLAFPSNDFGQEEPGTNEEIQKAAAQYSVTFPVFAKLSAAGEHEAPLFQFLTDKQTNPKTAGPIRWNFTKFVISREGKVLARFEPDTEPSAPELADAIDKALMDETKKGPETRSVARN